MGVPALFRWLSKKYPKIVSSVIEEKEIEINGVKIPIDYTKPNPNGEEFDNLYLDMNGIVHPCSHPEHGPVPRDEVEMMLAIFVYTGRVVRMVRPRKLLYMAVDGVAPRAKQNQQRKRRFMSAREAAEKDELKLEFDQMLRDKRMMAALGKVAEGDEDDEEDPAAEDDDDLPKKTWDSNAITPGTPFMHLLAESLKYWTQYMLNTDPSWANLKVIISDASVPGEGEHKIMNFVRSQRRSADHDPNTRHVMYGLDADLIMLGLVTHEPHFRVLREDVFYDSNKNACRKCGQQGHYADQCTGEAKRKEDEHKDAELEQKPFIWLHVSVLREYLEEEMHVPGQPFPFELERALDDWVFMCFFVGNDFLPHLPSLEIREDGIDTLIGIWRKALREMGGYITKDGQVIMQRAQIILKGLAAQEDGIFKRRKQADERREEGARRRAEQDANRRGVQMPPAKRVKETTETYANVPFFAPDKLQSAEARQITHEMAVNKRAMRLDKEAHNRANMSAAAVLKEQMRGKKRSAAEVEAEDSTLDTEMSSSALEKGKSDAVDDSDSGTPGRVTPIVEHKPSKGGEKEPHPDTVKLWEDGYAERYYQQKFGVAPDDYAFRHKVGEAYMEGLCWVLLYYLQGCPSWTWYYPYHYAPFAADFVDIDKMSVEFEKGEPFKPYEQLMAVLPAASNHAIPEAYRSLMTDEDSPIRQFYPVDFVLDLNGKKFDWQGVALIPFMDMDLLLKAMRTRDHLLTEDERARNQVGNETLIFSTQHPLYDAVTSAFYSKKAAADKTLRLDTKISHGLIGKVVKDAGYIPHSSLTFPLESNKMPDIENNQSISLIYLMPKSKSAHKSMLLTNLDYPTRVLNDGDKSQTRDRAGGNRGNYNNRGSFNNRGGSNGRGGYANGNNSAQRPYPPPPIYSNRYTPGSQYAQYAPGAYAPGTQNYGSGYGAQPRGGYNGGYNGANRDGHGGFGGNNGGYRGGRGGY